MADKPWSTVFPAGGLDAPAQMPDLVNVADRTLIEQIHALRDGIIAMEGEVGSDLLEAHSIRDVLTLLTNPADVPPAVPSAYDDEFVGGLGGGWWWEFAGAPAAVVAPYSEDWGVGVEGLWMRFIQGGSSFATAHCLYKSSPATWTATIKVRGIGISNNDCWGIIAGQGAGNICILKRNEEATPLVAVDRYGPGLLSFLLQTHVCGRETYLRMRWDGTKFSFWCSRDGTGWALMGDVTPAWVPDKFGIFSWAYSPTGGERFSTTKFFRVTMP